MLNLVQLHEGDVVHPVSGGRVKSSQLIVEYFGPFSLALNLIGVLRRSWQPVPSDSSGSGDVL
jgi:hypothetical protein